MKLCTHIKRKASSATGRQVKLFLSQQKHTEKTKSPVKVKLGIAALVFCHYLDYVCRKRVLITPSMCINVLLQVGVKILED
jgi:hypothetical protein